MFFHSLQNPFRPRAAPNAFLLILISHLLIHFSGASSLLPRVIAPVGNTSISVPTQSYATTASVATYRIPQRFGILGLAPASPSCLYPNYPSAEKYLRLRHLVSIGTSHASLADMRRKPGYFGDVGRYERLGGSAFRRQKHN